MSSRIIIGDCRVRLRELADQSVHCCVTSPPYFGLRDYGTAQWRGGDPACTHEPDDEWIERRQSTVALNGGTANQRAAQRVSFYNRDGSCHCGARRIDNQMGLEQSVVEYVEGMVEVFAEVRRVLRDDGTLWLNIGDSWGSGKNLIGVPWMLAFALRADGWILRQELIWSKPNPMPESVRDRCTKAHEQIFLLSKSPKYFFDAEAIAEKADTVGREIVTPDYGGGAGYQATAANRTPSGNQVPGAVYVQSDTRNKRSVWAIASQPFAEAHFATYPPALIEPCILAGCPQSACALCGAPVIRVVERQSISLTADGVITRGLYPSDARALGMPQNGRVGCRTVTTGWTPTCSCDDGTVPGVVLDPFGGAGTTALVAERLQRDAVMIELNSEYAEITRRRLVRDAPLFAEIGVEEAA